MTITKIIQNICNSKIKYFWVITLLSGFCGCMEDEALKETRNYNVSESTGVFITNEGNFTWGNASLSYYDYKTKEVINDIFYETNDLPLGDVLQSMSIRDSLGYLVVNNSGKIYIININTFEYVGKITGFTSPRYIHFLEKHKAYVTDLWGKSIWVIDPLGDYETTGFANGSIIDTIDVDNGNKKFFQHSTEQMVQYGDFVYTNCWTYDDKILVIDTKTDQIVDSISTLKQPTSLVMDKNDKIWIVSDGCYDGSIYGWERPGLQRIDPFERKVEKTWRFDIEDWPQEIVINPKKDTVYFVNRHIYCKAVDNDDAPEIFIKSPYVETPYAGYYGIDVDPYTGDVYVADAIDYVQQGIIYRFQSNGSPVDTFKVGVIPGAFCFKPKKTDK